MRRRPALDVCYRVLLRCYPRGFRARFSDPMTQMFRDRYRRAAARGALPAIAFLAATVADAVRNGVAERQYAQLSYLQRDSMVLQSLVTDFRQAAHVLMRAPRGTTLLAIATLALGIGANTAIFSVIHSVMIAPLPYPGADRVAIAWRHNPRFGDVSVSPSMTDAAAWRASGHVEALPLANRLPS